MAAAHKPATAATPKPDADRIARLLASQDPERRAEGFAAAGYHQIAECYDRVLDEALHGSGVERNAALYGLGFYRREAPEPALRQLLKATDPEFQITTLELASRRNPGRFSQEAMEIVHAQIGRMGGGGSDDWEANRRSTYFRRILSRFARGGLPEPILAGLKDPDPRIRRLTAEALGMAGDPAAVRSIVPLLGDVDAQVKRAAQAALGQLGPGEP